MNYIPKTQIIENIDEEVKAVEIIRSHEDANKCSVILNTRMMSIPYETQFNFDLIVDIKKAVNDETLVIMFVDNELPEAWKNSYLEGGITEDRFDRRTEYHAYNDMNEMFCIDRMTLMEIRGDFDGTEWEASEWKVGIIKWYRNHLI